MKLAVLSLAAAASVLAAPSQQVLSAPAAYSDDLLVAQESELLEFSSTAGSRFEAHIAVRTLRLDHSVS